MYVGDILDPDAERTIFSTIDNQMYGVARMHSGGNGVVRTGSFSIAADGSGTYTVTLAEASGEPAFEAFINQIYVVSTDDVLWEGLSNSTTYYLYARLVEGAEEGGSSRRDAAFITAAATVDDIPSDGVLLASVVIDEPGSTVFDTAPAGRIDIPTLLDHIQDYTDPHGSTLIQTDMQVTNLIVDGAATFSGECSLAGTVYLDSGLTVDGVDPTVLVPLFGGGNVDDLHRHDLAALIPTLREIGRSPAYSDTVASGVYDGVLETLRDGDINIYRWTGQTTPATKRLALQQYVPTDFRDVSQVLLTAKVDDPGTASVTVTLTDTAGNDVPLTGGVLNDAAYTENAITSSGGQFTPGDFFTLNLDLLSTSGFGVYISDLVIEYNTSGVS